MVASADWYFVVVVASINGTRLYNRKDNFTSAGLGMAGFAT